MADKSNPGIVNVNAVESSILNNGGGKRERPNYDGSTHVTLFDTNGRHISYDRSVSGEISNVHSSKRGHSYMDYKGGY